MRRRPPPLTLERLRGCPEAVPSKWGHLRVVPDHEPTVDEVQFAEIQRSATSFASFALVIEEAPAPAEIRAELKRRWAELQIAWIGYASKFGDDESEVASL